MHFAIIGDGPVALTLLSYFVYCKSVHKEINIKITLFVSVRSESYTRNHIVSISKETAKILETLVCKDSCLNPKNLPFVSIQIKCLETLLFEHIDKTDVIIKSEWTPTSDMSAYDYIFCADGGRSNSRNTFFGQYTPLTVRFSNHLLSLYWNFPENCFNFETTPEKKTYDVDDLKREWGGDDNYNNINAMISLVYNINHRVLEFTPPPHHTRTKKSLDNRI